MSQCNCPRLFRRFGIRPRPLNVVIRLGIVGLINLSLAGCFDDWQIKREIVALRQAADGELQKKRALLISEESLKQLDRIDVAVSLPGSELDRFRELLVG